MARLYSPAGPSVCTIMRSVPTTPPCCAAAAGRSAAAVCSRVFTTSKGVVTSAAVHPASAPTPICAETERRQVSVLLSRRCRKGERQYGKGVAHSADTGLRCGCGRCGVRGAHAQRRLFPFHLLPAPPLDAASPERSCRERRQRLVREEFDGGLRHVAAEDGTPSAWRGDAGPPSGGARRGDVASSNQRLAEMRVQRLAHCIDFGHPLCARRPPAHSCAHTGPRHPLSKPGGGARARQRARQSAAEGSVHCSSRVRLLMLRRLRNRAHAVAWRVRQPSLGPRLTRKTACPHQARPAAAASRTPPACRRRMLRRSLRLQRRRA